MTVRRFAALGAALFGATPALAVGEGGAAVEPWMAAPVGLLLVAIAVSLLGILLVVVFIASSV